jgi:hypothetical protein
LIEAVQGAVMPVQTVAPVATVEGSPPQMAVAPVQAVASPASVDVKGKPAPTKTSPAESTESAEPAPLDEAAVQRLRSRWAEFMGIVKNKSGFKQEAALRAVRDIAIGQQSVAFAFGNNKFARDMISAPETLTQVAEILSQILGRAVSLTCQTGETATLSAGAGRVVRDSVDSDGPDPLVEYAVNELGAQVESSS